MKKTFFIALCAALVLLSSCTTTLSVNTLAPAEVNLGGEQVIAVATPKAYKTSGFFKTIPVYADEGVPIPKEIRGWDSSETYSTGSNIAKYAANAVSSALSEGVYQIVDPATTDLWSKSRNLLTSKGVTMLLEGSIDAMNLDECIVGHAQKGKDGTVSYVYKLVQSVNITYSYRLTDLRTGRVVDAYAFTGKYPSYSEGKETTIATMDANKKLTVNSYVSYDAESLYEVAIDSFKEQIRDRLVPHTIKLNFNLLDTKEKIYADINALVNDGYIGIALDKYQDIYNRTHEVISGYNLAVLYYAMGKPEQAIAFAKDLYSKTLNADVGKLIDKMQTYYSMDQAAKSQAGLPRF